MRDHLPAATVTAASNDAQAMEALYRHYSPMVWRYAIRRCRNADQAADLVATVFLEAIESAARFDPRRGTPSAWLIGIAAHTLAELRRRSAREIRGLARLSGADLLSADEHELIDERIDAVKRADKLAEAIAALPASERELLLLVAYDGLAPSEAASVLGIRPAAARMRLARARRRIRRTEARERARSEGAVQARDERSPAR